MRRIFPKYKKNAAIALWDKFNFILYICGLRDFWIEPMDLSEKFKNIFSFVSFILHILSGIFNASLLLSFVVQNNLSTKQKADQSVCNLANPFSNFYCWVFLYHRRRCREVLYTLYVSLKQDHNDLRVEEKMIRKLKIYLFAYFGSGLMTLVFYALFGLKSVLSGGPFITIITAWPDVTDETTEAEVARVVFYVFWWISFTRISACYLILLSLLIGIGHQYMNLQSYFYSLEAIFEEDMSQVDKEKKYEKAFIKGVVMHSQTMWCKNQTQQICHMVFDAQMLLSTIAFISLLPAIMSPESDASTKLSCIPLALICLVATGFFMWNAGDISVEASKLPSAMYGSGWQLCRGPASVRARKLLVLAMEQAQRPEVLKALGFIELSHESYLTIIKTSHSVFSVFY